MRSFRTGGQLDRQVWGMFIEPVIQPLGFNWKIGIGLLTSVLAREVIVGTLGTLYGGDPATQIAGTAGGAAA